MQYVLSYSIILNNECPDNKTDFNHFSIWEIAGWLIEKYPKFRDEFNNLSGWRLTRDNRIQAKFDGIESKVKKLAYLELIEVVKGHIEGSNADTNYRFTESGYLLAWIIEALT